MPTVACSLQMTERAPAEYSNITIMAFAEELYKSDKTTFERR